MSENTPKIFVVSGPSGAGKTTVVNEILKLFPDSGRILNTTSRKKRVGETELKDYRFLSTGEFVSKFERDEFLEAGHFLGDCYGTLTLDFDEASEKYDTLFWSLDVKGLKNIKGKVENITSIFILDKLENLTKRIKDRGFEGKDLDERLQQAEWEISETANYDYVVSNDMKLQETVDEVTGIVRKNIG